MVKLPSMYWDEPLPAFSDLYRERRNQGIEVLRQSCVSFVGLARNCGTQLITNLQQLEHVAAGCGKWSLHIEENDSTDHTLEVLQAFAKTYKQATFTSQILGRCHYGAEFAGRRTIALAEYRDACQRWVRDCAADADYVIVMDWDQFGGWSHNGLLTGLGWLAEMPDAYGMASVSLNEFTMVGMDEDRQPKLGKGWTHYDAWALRGVGQSDCYFDDYTTGLGGWKHMWLPLLGSPPVLVSSAFGGLCIYRNADFLQGTYDGTSDCEHVAFHRSIAKATGRRLYLNPSQRCVMAWMADDAGQHVHD
jgi:hypothetical protein